MSKKESTSIIPAVIVAIVLMAGQTYRMMQHRLIAPAAPGAQVVTGGYWNY